MMFPPRVAPRGPSKWALATMPVLLLGTTFPAASQTAVSGDPTCLDCAIRLDPLLSIGDADPESWVEFTERLVLLDRHLILTRGSVPTELSIFSREGIFQRNLGRSGGGPGEFGWIHDIAQTGDGRLHVSDRRHGRISIYAPDLTLERVVPLPARPVDIGLLAFEDGSYVVNALVGTAELMELPLHRIGPEGEILLSYPVPSTEVLPGREVMQLRRLAQGQESTFWSVGFPDYRVVRYHIDGALLDSFAVDPPWPAGEAEDPGQGVAQPGVMAVEERDGRLWVVSRRLSPRYRSAMEQRRGVHGITWEIAEYHRYFESVLDVIEIETHRLLVRTVVPGYLLRFVEPGVILSWDDSRPEPLLVLRRVRMEERSGSH